MTPTEIARSLLGVPWVHQGRNPTVGLDCAGLLIVAYGESDEPDYGRDPQEGKLEAEITSRVGPPLEGCEDIRDGDIVAMAYAGEIRHCGMVALGDDGRLNLIHTDSRLGRLVEHPLDGKWLRRIRMVWRPDR